MVGEFITNTKSGGLALALEFLQQDLVQHRSKKISSAAPTWVLVEVEERETRLYPPALPYELRRALAEKRLLWVRAAEAATPGVVQTLLESSLCAGVLLMGLEKFPRLSPASTWCRRWQIAARRGGAHFIWVHEAGVPTGVGFDVRLEWTDGARFEIKRGHGFFEKKGRDVIFKRNGDADRPAA